MEVVADLSSEAFPSDDECTGDDGRDACAVHALQLRASSKGEPVAVRSGASTAPAGSQTGTPVQTKAPGVADTGKGEREEPRLQRPQGASLVEGTAEEAAVSGCMPDGQWCGNDRPELRCCGASACTPSSGIFRCTPMPAEHFYPRPPSPTHQPPRRPQPEAIGACVVEKDACGGDFPEMDCCDDNECVQAGVGVHKCMRPPVCEVDLGELCDAKGQERCHCRVGVCKGQWWNPFGSSEYCQEE